jgi:FkbM family methyltransferase
LKRAIRRFLDEALRGRFLAAYCRVRPRLTETIGGHRITYEPSTDIGRALFFSGQFEKSELQLCEKYIPPDSTVLDIGANIGLHSVFFSHVASVGRVLSFEPDLETFDMLRDNVSGLGNVTPLNLAMSDEGGVREFFHGRDGAYSSLADTKRTPIEKRTSVPCMRVDDFVAALRLDRVDFVKIDVEGFEHHVLRGMSRTISSFRPVIFCEIYMGVASNQRPDETVGFLLNQGYDAFVMRAGALAPYERHDDNFYNYLFLPRNRS